MKERKKMVAIFLALGVCCNLILPITQVRGLSYVVQGVYQITAPAGSRDWTMSLTAGEEYDIYLGLYTPGHAHFTLSVIDPWSQHYTFVDLEFYHSETSDDLYRSTFTPPITGDYVFTLTTTGGSGQALQAYLAVLDTGPISNRHTYAGLPLRDAHACNKSHAVWAYFLSLQGSTTYYFDVARGDPSGTDVPMVVDAKVQALNGLEIPVLIGASLPWNAPKCNESQVMQWAGDWFGVSASTTYNLIVTVSGLDSLDPVVIAITVSKEQSHGSSEPPADDNSSAGSTGLQVSLEGVMIVAAPCALGLLIVGIAVVGIKRKRSIRGEAGVMKRELPAGEW